MKHDKQDKRANKEEQTQQAGQTNQAKLSQTTTNRTKEQTKRQGTEGKECECRGVIGQRGIMWSKLGAIYPLCLEFDERRVLCLWTC